MILGISIFFDYLDLIMDPVVEPLTLMGLVTQPQNVRPKGVPMLEHVQLVMEYAVLVSMIFYVKNLLENSGK